MGGPSAVQTMMRWWFRQSTVAVARNPKARRQEAPVEGWLRWFYSDEVSFQGDMARKRKGGHGKRYGDDQNPPATRVRSQSKGEYGSPPTVPRPINVSSTHILDNTATKTLLAIIRANWPVGTFTFKKAPSTFWPSVISMFRKYYSYHPGVLEADGDAVVKLHVARTMTQTLYEERNRAMIRAERNNTTLQEQCPAYFDEDVWRSFCSNWHKTSFRKKSAINTENRKNLKVVHTTGAKPFYKFKQDLNQKYSESPTTLQLWDESHKNKNTDEWASERARLIGDQMRKILESKQASGESSRDWKSGISALIEAQGPIKKNRVLGLPRIPANSVIQALQAGKQHQSLVNHRAQPSSSRSGAGCSISCPWIPDETFGFY